MSLNRMSQLRLYSLGIVSEDKPRNTNKIKVTPIEEISMFNDRLKDLKIEYNIDMPDHKGVKRKDKMEGDISIVAVWLPFGNPNRSTPPDVIEGETVMLWRFADTDEYYWTTNMFEPLIRRQETVNYIWGNIPKKDYKTAFDKDTAYWFEVSTHDKYVHLHTSNNDTEPFKYDVKIDTAVGTVLVTDDVGNSILLDSPNNKLTITTNVDVEVNTQNAVVNAGTKVDVNSPDVTVNASSSTTVNSPDIKLNGDVTINGSLSTSGGDVTLAGGDIKMTGGAITANGEDLNVDVT